MARLRLVRCGFLFVLALSTAGCEPDRTWNMPYDALADGWVMSAYAASANEVYAVGGALDAGRITLFDGQNAVPQEVPAGTPLVNWAFGFGDGEVYAVGNEGAILHYDGTDWEAEMSPTNQDLWGVWGAAPDDIWAVGGSARLPGEGEPTLVHYDGTEWVTVEIPTLTPSGVAALFKVWGSGADDVYVVGDVGVVLHYDGSDWSELLVGAEDDLVAVWGTGPDNVVAVGGRSNGIVAHWNGTEWRTEFVTPLPGLNGVWLDRAGRAHVAGLRGTVGVIDLDSFEVTTEEVDEFKHFHALAGVDGVLFAVGGNLAVPSAPEGMVWRRNL